MVLPATWKRCVGLPIGAPKDASGDMAVRLWPAHARSFRHVMDDGMAEACLIGTARTRRGAMGIFLMAPPGRGSIYRFAFANISLPSDRYSDFRLIFLLKIRVSIRVDQRRRQFAPLRCAHCRRLLPVWPVLCETSPPGESILLRVAGMVGTCSSQPFRHFPPFAPFPSSPSLRNDFGRSAMSSIPPLEPKRRNLGFQRGQMIV